MKIAIANDNGMVSSHFGKCSLYTIVNIDEKENKVINKNNVDNPGKYGHEPGILPEFLKKEGVDIVISGGMGRRAQEFFNNYGIETIVGITGSIDEVIENILKGTLKGGDSLCDKRIGENCKDKG